MCDCPSKNHPIVHTSKLANLLYLVLYNFCWVMQTGLQFTLTVVEQTSLYHC